MNEKPINPDDPGFLLSRQLDGELPEAERQKLADALDASKSLRADAESMEKTTGLLRRWGLAPVELDWDAHAALIDALCEAAAASADQSEIDDILNRWTGKGLEFDETQFTAGVMQRVSGDRHLDAPSSRRWVFRIAAPLAAAAALAFALLGGPWMSQEPDSRIAENLPAETEPIESNPFDAPICIVAFAREMPREPVEIAPPSVDRPSGISFTAIGIVTGGFGITGQDP